jgi:hypothetical protein
VVKIPYAPWHLDVGKIKLMIQRANQHEDGSWVYFQKQYHYVFFPNVKASGGDIVFFYEAEDAEYTIGDSIAISGITYYVSATHNISIGDQDPYVRIALLTIYAPPDPPNVWSYRWGDLGSGKIWIYFGHKEQRFLDHFEVWRSFDNSEWHFLDNIDTGPFSDEPPPLEHIWYKLRTVDTFYRKSEFTLPLKFTAQWQRFFDNPVLEKSPGWSSWGVTCPTLFYAPADQNIHMFYGGMTWINVGYQIGHATLSISDWKNLNWTNWVPDPANPIMTPGGVNFMQNGVFEPYVIWADSRFICVHTGYDNHRGTGMDAAGIGAFTSPSLSGPWTQVDNTTPRIPLGAGGEWDDYDVFAASLGLYGSTWWWWYSGSGDAAQNWKIGRAYSTDPVSVATKDAENPILSPTGSGWEQEKVFFMRFLSYGNHNIGYYQGHNAAGQGQWGSVWTAGPTDDINKTPFNPDIRYTSANEATLRIGGNLFKDPFSNTWTFWYGSADFPESLAEIRAMILVPIEPR